MNMQMPDMKKMKKAAKDANDLRLSLSMDAGAKLKRKNELHAIKSWAFHTSCNIPVLKAALVMLGVAAALMLWAGMRKKMSCG